MWLILSGNFSWLNFLTLTLAISAFNDPILERVLPIAAPSLPAPPVWWQALSVAVALLVAVLGFWPGRNMLSRRPLLNFRFNPLHLVNAYGAFGSGTRDRYEVVVEGTEQEVPGSDANWREYEFKAKPGDPGRRPPQIAPYHLRLDWLMWFAAMSSP